MKAADRACVVDYFAVKAGLSLRTINLQLVTFQKKQYITLQFISV